MERVKDILALCHRIPHQLSLIHLSPSNLFLLLSKLQLSPIDLFKMNLNQGHIIICKSGEEVVQFLGESLGIIKLKPTNAGLNLLDCIRQDILQCDLVLELVQNIICLGGESEEQIRETI